MGMTGNNITTTLNCLDTDLPNLHINAEIATIRNFSPKSRLMALAARQKLNATNCMITEDPSLMFSIVGQTRDQTKPGSLLARLRGRLDERPWERG